MFSFSPSSSERVSSGAILRLALAEAHPDVALELDGVAVGELEGVERCREESLLTVVLPFPENVRVCWTAVLVRDSVDGLLVVVVDRPRDAVPGKAAVNLARRNLNLNIKNYNILIIKNTI